SQSRARKPFKSCFMFTATVLASAAFTRLKLPRPRWPRSSSWQGATNIRYNAPWKRNRPDSMPSLSRSLEQALHRAIRLASERHHEYATLEHLLLALVDDSDAAQVMRACNVDLDALRAGLTKYVDEDLATLTIEDGEDAKPTTGFQRVVQRAVLHVQNSGRDEVTGANVLVALFSERESHAVYFLQEQNMSRLDAVNYMSHGIAKRPGMSQAKPVRGTEEEEESGEKVVKQGTDALEAYCVNL